MITRREMLAATVASMLLERRLSGTAQNAADARGQVDQTERRFAETMARRDFQAFQTFLSDEAIFIGSGENPAPLRGKRAVAERWRAFFEAPGAPFSWSPDLVEVLESGGLALSSGPVRNPEGALIGRFTSIWRRESDGSWRIIFDFGSPVCRS